MDVLLLIGHGSRDPEALAEYHAFATALGDRLGLATEACFLEFAQPSIPEGLRRAAEDLGAARVTALPLFLGPAGHQKNDVPAALNWAKGQYPAVRFRYGTPLGAHYGLVRAAAERIEAVDTDPDPAHTAVLLVGRGSRDPDSNSDLFKVARLLAEGRDYLSVEACFYDLAQPDVAAGIARCLKLGAARVIVMPYLLFTGRILSKIAAQVAEAGARHPGIDFRVSAHLGLHEGVFEAAAQRWQEAHTGVAAMTCDLCKYRHKMTGFEAEHGLPQTSDHSHGLRGLPAHSHALDAILPPRYQGGTEVDAAVMPNPADLLYAEDGSVAWDAMWQGFCELGIAGGPPHRGDLLEPPTPEACRAAPEAYARVTAELMRGLRLVTGLEPTESRSPGWVGLPCSSEQMAIWLLRAVLVENVFARREDDVLYLPAGPHYRLDKEIKNVITAVAKTHHYWLEHISAGAPAEAAP